MTLVTTEPTNHVEPEPVYIFGAGAVKHIARPDHPSGVLTTDVAFCGAYETDLEEPDRRRVCKRCAVGWVAYLDRIAREAGA